VSQFPPEIHYVDVGGAQVAYQVVGEGPTFDRFHLSGDASPNQDGARRMIGLDGVQHGVDDAMCRTRPLDLCHRATERR